MTKKKLAIISVVLVVVVGVVVLLASLAKQDEVSSGKSSNVNIYDQSGLTKTFPTANALITHKGSGESDYNIKEGALYYIEPSTNSLVRRSGREEVLLSNIDVFVAEIKSSPDGNKLILQIYNERPIASSVFPGVGPGEYAYALYDPFSGHKQLLPRGAFGVVWASEKELAYAFVDESVDSRSGIYSYALIDLSPRLIYQYSAYFEDKFTILSGRIFIARGSTGTEPSVVESIDPVTGTRQRLGLYQSFSGFISILPDTLLIQHTSVDVVDTQSLKQIASLPSAIDDVWCAGQASGYVLSRQNTGSLLLRKFDVQSKQLKNLAEFENIPIKDVLSIYVREQPNHIILSSGDEIYGFEF